MAKKKPGPDKLDQGSDKEIIKAIKAKVKETRKESKEKQKQLKNV